MVMERNDDRDSHGNSDFWDIVAERTDRLTSQWHDCENSPPPLERLLDDVPRDMQRPLLWELIKVDLEIRWREKDMPMTLEEYVGMYPLLGPVKTLPADLIFEEYQIRKASGNPVSLKESTERFPSQQKALNSLESGVAPTIAFESGVSDRARNAKATSGFHRPEMYNEGESIDEFELLLLLGAGSFARVFLARQRGLDRLVALKISANKGQEPRTLAQLEHPNIVRVYDQRTAPSESIRLLYMELVPGGSLDDAIKGMKEEPFTAGRLFAWIDSNLTRVGAAPPISSDWRAHLRTLEWPFVVCQFAIHLAEGLAHAHHHGILHRDIKPANILLTAEGIPKLADFNISFNAAGDDERPGDTFGGSLAYMSPEQLSACHTALGGDASNVREASDIYSLALVVIELLSGERVFTKPSKGTDWEASLRQMLKDRKAIVRQTADDLFPADTPASVREVLSACVAHSPADRPETATALANRLRVCLNPRLWELLQKPKSIAGRTITRWPLICLFLATLIPMAPIAIFNFMYNRRALIAQFPDSVARFDEVQWWVNLTGFPLGILMGIYLGVRALYWAQHRREPLLPLVHLGRDLAVVAMGLWFLSGIVFPLLLHYSTTGSDDVMVFTLFMLSLILCGLIAGTYPYLMVTFLCIRYLLPAQLHHNQPYPSPLVIRSTRATLRIFVALTAIVPMVATLLAVMFRDQHQATLILLSVVGIFGFLVALWAGHAIDRDLQAIEEHVRTHD